LFEEIEAGRQYATTSETIIAEVAWVLSSRQTYNLSHEEVADRLSALLLLSGLRLERKKTYLRALILYAEHPHLDYADALSVALLEDLHLTEITSYDRDFDRVPGVARVEPS
jgi:predicted nucleic acid-binding protein